MHANSFYQCHPITRYMGICTQSTRSNLLPLPQYVHFSIRLLDELLAVNKIGNKQRMISKNFSQRTLITSMHP